MFRKIREFRKHKQVVDEIYDNTISKNKELNLRKDRLGRLYTVFQIDENVKSFGKDMKDYQLRDFVIKCSEAFRTAGLEQVAIRQMDRLDDINFLIVYDYSKFDTAKYFNNLYRRVIVYGTLVVTISTIATIILKFL